MQIFGNFHFSRQKSGEELIIIVRRHWFNIFSKMLPVLLMLSVLIFGFIFLPVFLPVLQTDVLRGFFMFLENFFALAIWIIFFLVLIDYYFDVWIITNRRVVNVEQKGLFSRSVSELEIRNIQDITTEVKGVVPTFLNYGDVYIQTAAEEERFVFRQVADPYSIKDKLMNLQKMEERENTETFKEIIEGKNP